MTGSRFCIKCGKDNLKKADLIENLCLDCYREMNPLFKIDRQRIPTLFICKNCQNFRFDYSKNWFHPGEYFLDEIIDELSQHVTRFIKSDENIKVILAILDEDKLNYELLNSNRLIKIKIKAMKKDFENSEHEIMEEEEIPIRVNFSICDKCTKIQRNLSKVELQFQGKNRKLKEDEVLYIEEIIENEFEKYLEADPDAYILVPTKREKILKYKLSSFKLAKKIANLIKNQLDGSIRESFKYEDREKNRAKVKSNAIIRVLLPPFRVGEAFELNYEIYQVEMIVNKKIIAINLDNLQKEKFSYNDLKHAREIRSENLNSYMVLSITQDNLQVMDNKSYSIYDIPLQTHLINVKEGMEVKGLKKENKVILIQLTNVVS
ncbi:MAG: hypothetical protein EAX96_08730 [Candidatus Lokiarchaeota archaeon]|nr:hypothetical protein [Candidatus Lokiarchaeota archaeon]